MLQTLPYYVNAPQVGTVEADWKQQNTDPSTHGSWLPDARAGRQGFQLNISLCSWWILEEMSMDRPIDEKSNKSVWIYSGKTYLV